MSNYFYNPADLKKLPNLDGNSMRLIIVHASAVFDEGRIAKPGIELLMTRVGKGKGRILELTRKSCPSYLTHQELVDEGIGEFAHGLDEFIFAGGRIEGCSHQNFLYLLKKRMITGQHFVTHFPLDAAYGDGAIEKSQVPKIISRYSNVFTKTSEWQFGHRAESAYDNLDIPAPKTKAEKTLPFRTPLKSIPFVAHYNGKQVKSNSKNPFAVLYFWDRLPLIK